MEPLVPKHPTGIGARLALAFKLVAMGLPLVGCGSVPVRPPSAELHVVTEPETASVIVDERPAGTGRVLALRALTLDPGVHRVTVIASGFFPHDLEVDLPEGVTTLRIALRPVPP